MKLTISDEVCAKFPDLRIAILIGRGIDNTGTNPELQDLKHAAAQRMHDEHTNDDLTKSPEIQAWRDAYRAFGVKPRESRPTAEAFLRRLIKGEEFPTISKAVDSYLLVETEFFLPIGGYDVSQVSGNIQLRTSPGDEAFTPLGSTAEEVTRPGEVIYADDARVLTRKWNYRDCDSCKITADSKDIVLFTEAPADTIATNALVESATRMAQYIGKFCGGTFSTALADVSQSPELEIA